jgi:hypothetical protein
MERLIGKNQSIDAEKTLEREITRIDVNTRTVPEDSLGNRRVQVILSIDDDEKQPNGIAENKKTHHDIRKTCFTHPCRRGD